MTATKGNEMSRHPVEEFRGGDAFSGGKARPDQLDAIAKEIIDGTEEPGTTYAELRRKLKEAADKIVALNAEGQFKDARDIARQVGGELTNKLGEYIEPSPNVDEMDPKRLAAMV